MPDGMIKPKRTLRGVAPETVEPKKPKVIVFGKEGVGKTWASLDFPGVYYIDTEGGADLNHYREKLKASGGAYMGPEQGSLDFDTLIEEMRTLAEEKHDFRTVVIDSLSKLWNNALSEEQERLGDKDAFGAYKKIPLRKFNTLIRWVNKLDMTVIFICHHKDMWGKDEKGNQGVVGSTYDGPEKLGYELHLVLNIVKVTPISRVAKVGKSRLTGFPEGGSFPWGFAEFAERYGKDIIEKAASQISIASADQVSEIARLLERVKVPEDWVEKVFKASQVESWDEMEADKIAGYIEKLKERLQ